MQQVSINKKNNPLIELKLIHHGIALGELSACGFVQSVRCLVAAVGQHPGVDTAELFPQTQQFIYDGFADAFALMHGRNARFVDP